MADKNEKIYVTMSHSAVTNIAVGVIIMATGIASGVLLLISGARLLKQKSGMTF